MRWAFIGSGPSAPGQVDAILPRLRPCKTITCNAGLKLLPGPDVYFLSDHVACKRYMPLVRLAKEYAGTHLVTMHRFRQAQEARGVEWFDEFVQNGVDPPTRERWGCFNQSGPFCLEYACRNGAKEIHLLGCEGYSDHSYFDRDERPTDYKIADAETNPQLVKRTTYVVEAFADVAFYVYGEPHYTIHCPNWHVLPSV